MRYALGSKMELIGHAILFLTVATAAALCVFGLCRSYLRQRTTARAEAWARFIEIEEEVPDARRARIIRTYQYARTGTKAFIRWDGVEREQDSWFEGNRVWNGDRVLVTGHEGYGRHHNRKCWYVEPDELFAMASGDAEACYGRVHCQDERRSDTGRHVAAVAATGLVAMLNLLTGYFVAATWLVTPDGPSELDTLAGLIAAGTALVLFTALFTLVSIRLRWLRRWWLTIPAVLLLLIVARMVYLDAAYPDPPTDSGLAVAECELGDLSSNGDHCWLDRSSCLINPDPMITVGFGSAGGS
jgi:hypothetical protein